MLAVVGALVFTQYWYWFPLAHCLALAFTPTCLIALNAQLKMPKLEIRSNARPSVYAYPAPLEEKKREEREKVTTAVLSIAARARRRESERKARDSHEKMEVVSRRNRERSRIAAPRCGSNNNNNLEEIRYSFERSSRKADYRDARSAGNSEDVGTRGFRSRH